MRYEKADEAWGLMCPSGKLVPAATAERDALFYLFGEHAGVDPVEVEKRLLARGYKAVRVKIEVEPE
jgi:hypothetical protein